VVLISGEAGAGKTTLVEHVLATLDTPVLRGRAVAWACPAYEVVASALRPAVRDTARELDVMELVSQGNTSRQAGHTLFISPRTVEMHVNSSMQKLRCRTRAEAVRRLTELGALPGPDMAGKELG
jgi:DNA-binding CsgD family transcriptional regulator